MPPIHNFQDIPYVPDHDRWFWEVAIDWVLPPIRYPDGRRYDHDYLERLIFHVLGIGGPCDDRYIPPETLEKITELWEIWLVTYAEWKEDARENWERRKEAFRARLASVAGWIATKAGWPTALCLRHENEDEEEGDEPDLESGEPIIGESLCKSPQSATARQPLLQNARLYGAISSQGPEGVPDTLVQPDLSLISTSPGGKAPSALPGSQGLFRSWSKKSRRRSVRFHEVHNIVMYKHVDWEQLGRTQPNLSHLLEPQDPQIEYIISLLHAVSSSSRQSPSTPLSPPAGYRTPQPIPCEA